MRRRKRTRVTPAQQELRMLRGQAANNRMKIVLVSEHGWRARVNLAGRISQLEDDMSILFDDRY